MTIPCHQEQTGRAARLLPYAVIVLLSVVLFSPFIFRGRIFLAADILYTNYPWKAQAPPGFKPHNELIADPVNHNWAGIYNRQLHQGGLKNWNPYILTGVPNTGLTAMSGMPGRWYPLKLLLHRLFPTPVALNLLLFVHVTLMGLTMYLYLSEIGAGRRGALFGAVAYMFNGCAMAWLEYEFVVASSALVPLLLLCLERLREGRRWFWASAGGGVLGLMWLMSHLQYMIYAHLLLGFYLLFLGWRSLRQRAPGRDLAALGATFFSVIAVGALIGAIEVLPTLELIRKSVRVHRQYHFGELFERVGRIPWRQMVTLVFPDYFGNPVLGFTALSTPPSQGSMMFNELALNVGVPTLFALLAATVAPRVSHTRFFLALALLSSLLMTGSFVAYPFFRFVPGMDKMTPTRIVWLFTFSAAVAGGLGFGSLTPLQGRRRKVYLALVLLLAVSVAALSLVSSTRPLLSFFNGDRLSGAEARTTDIPGKLAALRSLSSPVILKPLLLTVASIILFILIIRVRKAGQGLAVFAAILGLLAFELVGAARTFNTTVKAEMIYPRTPAIDFLLRQRKPFRAVSVFGLGETAINTLAPFGIEELGGYSSVGPYYSSKQLSMTQLGLDRMYDRWFFFDRLDSPLIDLANARFFLTAPGSGPPRDRLRLVYQGEMDIYENLSVLPRAFAVHGAHFVRTDYQTASLLLSPDFDMRNELVLTDEPDRDFLRGIDVPPARPPSVSMVSYGEDHVTVAADLSTNGWLVLSDAFYPGWEATVDGVPTPILRADLSYRAVPLPAGRHRVEFHYRPASLRWGRILTVVGACLVLMVLIAYSVIMGRGLRVSASSSPRD